MQFALHQSAASRRGNVVERRKQVLPATRAVGIVARAGGRVHLQVPGVARVRAAPEDPRAGGAGLQRRVAAALVVRVAERVGGGAGEHAGEVHDHAVHADVGIGRHQGRSLGSVRGLVERPSALAGALGRRVADPDVGRSGAGVVAVQAAPAHAESFHGHVLRREDHRNTALLGLGRRGQSGDLRQSEGVAHGGRPVGAIRELVREQHPGLLGRGVAGHGGDVLLVDGAPPLRDGRRRGLKRGCEGVEEIEDHRLLCQLEFAVPEYGHGDVAVEHGAALVEGEHGGWVWLVQLHAPPRPHAKLCRAHKDHPCKQHCCLCTNDGHLGLGIFVGRTECG
ncbi:unnamed protein product [Alopecurus aequalis]